MIAIQYIEATRMYLDYIEEHINNVEKAWNELQQRCSDMPFITDDCCYFNLCNEIAKHDISKLSAEEFVQYRQKFFPVTNEDNQTAFESALAHHIKNNLHHCENWTKSKHPLIGCVSMIVDWMAMGMKYGDTAQEYYENNKNNINIPEDWIPFMYKIFDRLKK